MVKVLLDGRRGIYIPRDFARIYNMPAWHVSDEDARVLIAGPGHPDYLAAWDAVLDTAYLVDDYGATWHLDQDGDLIAVRETNF